MRACSLDKWWGKCEILLTRFIWLGIFLIKHNLMMGLLFITCQENYFPLANSNFYLR